MNSGRYAPAATPAERREQLDQELGSRAVKLRKPQVPHTLVDLGLSAIQKRRARERALALLARAHRAEYLTLLAAESAAVAGGRG